MADRSPLESGLIVEPSEVVGAPAKIQRKHGAIVAESANERAE
jgi:hypothetical protein